MILFSYYTDNEWNEMALSPEEKKDLLRAAYGGDSKDLDDFVPTPEQLEWAKEVRLKEIDDMGEKHTVTNYFTQMMNGEKLTREFLDKVDEILGQPQWWLSFVDPDKAAPRDEQVPGGPGFLGVCIVRAQTDLLAVMRTHDLGINPGGEVTMFRIPPDIEYTPEMEDRFIGREEALTL